jgi:hypothetical protein
MEARDAAAPPLDAITCTFSGVSNIDRPVKEKPRPDGVSRRGLEAGSNDA